MNLTGKIDRIGRTSTIVLPRPLLSLLTLICLNLSDFSLQAAPVTTIPADASQYVGTWTAKHDGTDFIVLDVRREKGKLAGGMRMASFHMDNEGSGVKIEIFNDTLDESLPVRNLQNSDKSLTFDFKDPDGDETHWRLEVTGVNVGRLSWIGLPDGIKDVPVSVVKNEKKNR